jgi:Tfp pilus assembly protein PilF
VVVAAGVGRRRGKAAADDPCAVARSLQPWASSPYLQLALLAEQEGDLGPARRWIAGALERDPSDWRLWLVSARIETKTGSVTRARGDLAQARLRNPRSPLFAPRKHQRD